MRHSLSALLSLAMAIGLAGPAFAQTSSGGPSAGPGTTSGNNGGGTPTTTSGGGNSNGSGTVKEMDLPLEAPAFKGQPPKPPEEPPPPEQGDEKPPTIYGQELKSENDTIYYVLDISGSMGWDVAQYVGPDGSAKNGNRLDRAKAELAKSVMSLPENFKFNMLAYDCAYYPWQGDMQPADTAHKSAAIGWIYSRQPEGATGTGPATAMALQAKNNKLVVLLTDGDPNCGVAGSGDSYFGDSHDGHRSMIRQANKNNAVVNVFGIGATGSFKKFCMNVAGDNGGTYTDVR